MAKSGKLNKSVKSSVVKGQTGHFVSQERAHSVKGNKAHGSSLHLKEPEVSYTSRIRAIGNSKGVILNSQLMETAKLDPGLEIIVQAREGIITIEQVKEGAINTDLSTWDRQFERAIKRGATPEKDLFEGLENDFDSKEW